MVMRGGVCSSIVSGDRGGHFILTTLVILHLAFIVLLLESEIYDLVAETIIFSFSCPSSFNSSYVIIYWIVIS